MTLRTTAGGARGREWRPASAQCPQITGWQLGSPQLVPHTTVSPSSVPQTTVSPSSVPQTTVSPSSLANTDAVHGLAQSAPPQCEPQTTLLEGDAVFQDGPQLARRRGSAYVEPHVTVVGHAFASDASCPPW